MGPNIGDGLKLDKFEQILNEAGVAFRVDPGEDCMPV